MDTSLHGPSSTTDSLPWAGPLSGTNNPAAALVAAVEGSLDDDKAEHVVRIDLRGKSTYADAMVIASGRSQRHVAALAEKLMERLKQAGWRHVAAEGLPQGDWVLVDAGDVLVHLFRPEVRAFYRLEEMWGLPDAVPPLESTGHDLMNFA